MISKEEVKHIVKLARIKLADSEIEKFQGDLSNILDYFDLMKEIDTSGVEPVFHPTENFLRNEEPGRVDEAKSQSEETINKLIESAPDRKERHVKVKQIL